MNKDTSNNDTLDLSLPAETPGGRRRECHMSQQLFQNARLTMGELRDFMRECGISWDYIRSKIEEAEHPASAVDRIIGRLDEYSTGLGRSLHDKPSNIR